VGLVRIAPVRVKLGLQDRGVNYAQVVSAQIIPGAMVNVPGHTVTIMERSVASTRVAHVSHVIWGTTGRAVKDVQPILARRFRFAMPPAALIIAAETASCPSFLRACAFVTTGFTVIDVTCVQRTTALDIRCVNWHARSCCATGTVPRWDTATIALVNVTVVFPGQTARTVREITVQVFRSVKLLAPHPTVALGGRLLATEQSATVCATRCT